MEEKLYYQPRYVKIKRGLSPLARLLYDDFYIAAQGITDYCSISDGSFAELYEVSKREVSKSIRELEDAMFIEVWTSRNVSKDSTQTVRRVYLKKIPGGETHVKEEYKEDLIIPVYMDRSLSPSHKLLSAALIDLRDEDGACRLSDKELSEATGHETTTIKKLLKELSAAGHIIIENPDGSGKRKICFKGGM